VRSPCLCLCRPLGTDNLLAKRRCATYGGTRRWPGRMSHRPTDAAAEREVPPLCRHGGSRGRDRARGPGCSTPWSMRTVTLRPARSVHSAVLLPFRLDDPEQPGPHQRRPPDPGAGQHAEDAPPPRIAKIRAAASTTVRMTRSAAPWRSSASSQSPTASPRRRPAPPAEPTSARYPCGTTNFETTGLPSRGRECTHRFVHARTG
jgi:hypothetical protein